MSKGKIVAEGSTVDLKNQFGTGYLISGYKPGSEEIVSFKCSENDLEDGMMKIK